MPRPGLRLQSIVDTAREVFGFSLSLPGLTGLPTFLGLCYNLRAVESHVNVRPVPVRSESEERKQGGEHPISFCPVCSQRLESKRCKLVCAVCGYYLSCSDYY
jgi:hypothetical protein